MTVKRPAPMEYSPWRISAESNPNSLNKDATLVAADWTVALLFYYSCFFGGKKLNLKNENGKLTIELNRLIGIHATDCTKSFTTGSFHAKNILYVKKVCSLKFFRPSAISKEINFEYFKHDNYQSEFWRSKHFEGQKILKVICIVKLRGQNTAERHCLAITSTYSHQVLGSFLHLLTSKLVQIIDEHHPKYVT